MVRRLNRLATTLTDHVSEAPTSSVHFAERPIRGNYVFHRP
jgi:hypothetical protein